MDGVMARQRQLELAVEAEKKRLDKVGFTSQAWDLLFFVSHERGGRSGKRY